MNSMSLVKVLYLHEPNVGNVFCLVVLGTWIRNSITVEVYEH